MKTFSPNLAPYGAQPSSEANSFDGPFAHSAATIKHSGERMVDGSKRLLGGALGVARSHIQDTLSAAGRKAVSILLVALTALFAWLWICYAAVWGLSTYMAVGWAALIVAAPHALTAFILFRRTQSAPEIEKVAAASNPAYANLESPSVSEIMAADNAACLDHIRQGEEELLQASTAMKDAATDIARDAIETLNPARQIVKHPMQALLGALVLGALVGHVMSDRSESDRS